MVTAQRPQNSLDVKITEKAASKVKELASKTGKTEFALRVAVKGGGCSGLQYNLEIVAGPTEKDKVIKEHELMLLIDKKSYIFLAGTVLDFSDGLNGKGFTFANPNAKSVCGCGTSFSA